MGLSTTYRSRVAAHRPLVVLAVVALLIAVLGAIAISGSSRPSEVPIVIVTSTPSPAVSPSPEPSLASPLLASNGRIYVGTSTGIKHFAADGTDPQTLVVLPGGASGLAISPDGTKLAYLEGPEPGVIRIFTLATGLAVTVALPSEMIGGDQISWSPDSTEIAFPTAIGGKEYVYTAKIDGSPATRLGGNRIDETMGIWFPSYSPDGQSIAFIGIAGGAGQEPRAGDIYLASRDGSDVRKIAEGVEVGPGGTLTWSPDQDVRQLLFVRNGVQVLDVDGGLVTYIGSGFWPSWSPDGQRIALWSDGLTVSRLADAPALSTEFIRPFGRIFGSCLDHAELAGKAVCAPVSWSPGGDRVLGPDIVGGGIVALSSDGSADPFLLAGTSGAEAAVWERIRP